MMSSTVASVASQLRIQDLVTHAAVSWLNAPKSLMLNKKDTAFGSFLFVFNSYIVLLVLESNNKRKRTKVCAFSDFLVLHKKNKSSGLVTKIIPSCTEISS